jgi:hypothetical protein
MVWAGSSRTGSRGRECDAIRYSEGIVKECGVKGETTMTDNDQLVKEIAELKAKLAELEGRLPKEEKPFVPKAMPTFDPTEGFRMPASAAKPMADLIHGKNVPKFDPSAWARNSYPQPGGFGPRPGSEGGPVKHETYDSQRDGLWSRGK